MDVLLVSPEQAAKGLGIGRSRVYELLAAGTLPSVKLGASRRIRVADIRTFVDGLGAS